MNDLHIGPLDRPAFRVLAALIISCVLTMVVYVPLSGLLFVPLLAWKLWELWPVIAWQRERPRRRRAYTHKTTRLRPLD